MVILWYTVDMRKQQNDLRVWLEMGWYQFAKGSISLHIIANFVRPATS